MKLMEQNLFHVIDFYNFCNKIIFRFFRLRFRQVFFPYGIRGPMIFIALISDAKLSFASVCKVSVTTINVCTDFRMTDGPPSKIISLRGCSQNSNVCNKQDNFFLGAFTKFY